MTQPNMLSGVPLALPQKRDGDAFTWKIWAPTQEITGRSGQTVARSGRKSAPVRSGDELRSKTIQPQIYHPESKGNPQGQVPPRNVGLGLDRFGLELDWFGLGLWDHLKLRVHLRPPSESG